MPNDLRLGRCEGLKEDEQSSFDSSFDLSAATIRSRSDASSVRRGKGKAVLMRDLSVVAGLADGQEGGEAAVTALSAADESGE